ncbi:MAG: antibiotic biosynthesis monooxygenase [Nitrospira sp.]|nr:antibiotic biosynthesis monooxygenase [Nitrospira sp.]
MIYAIATIQLVEGKRDAFLEEFHKLVPKVRAEVGCIEYGPTMDVKTNIAAQGPLREHVVTIVEKWENIESLEAHVKAPHMLEYRAKVKDWVVSTSLQVLQPA